MSQGTFFKKLDQVKIAEVIYDLIRKETEIIVKVKGQHFKSKVLKESTKTSLLIYRFSNSKFKNDEVFCSFEIKDEKYFFKAFLTNADSEFKVTIPSEMFFLQRRNDFRMSIPIGTPYTCDVIRLNNSKVNFKVELRNLSLGGGQIAYPTSMMKIILEDEVTLKLKVYQFEKENLVCLAKHIKVTDTEEVALVGLQFVEPDADFLTELQGLLVNLDRIHRGKGYD